MSAIVYLSPHLDDAALSSGGLIASHVERGERPLVITVFTAAPPPGAPLTRFADELHEYWGAPALSVDAIWAQRRAEEARALAILGAEGRSLGRLDAIYRGDRYASPETLRGALHPEDGPLVTEVAAEVSPLLDGDAQMYAPLAVGRHVDHQLCHQVGRLLERRGARVAWYEDYPYVLQAGALEARLAEVGPLAPTVVDITRAIDRKLDAIACYTSQLPALFRERGPWRDETRAFAERFGGGARRAGERLWTTDPASR